MFGVNNNGTWGTNKSSKIAKCHIKTRQMYHQILMIERILSALADAPQEELICERGT